MSSYAAQIQALHEAIVQAAPERILPHINPIRANIFTPKQRFDVYGSAYLKQLKDATRTDYPVLEHYLGEKKMEQTLHAFAVHTPSQEWDLNHYPIHFARYLKTIEFDAAATALATLEATITEVYWLPDSEALDAQWLSVLPPDALEMRIFKPRTALRLLAADYAANAYLQAYRDEKPLATLIEQKEYVAVVRHHNIVRRLELDALEYRLLQQLYAGASFAQAFTDVPESDAEKVSNYLGRWLQYGFFAT